MSAGLKIRLIALGILTVTVPLSLLYLSSIEAEVGQLYAAEFGLSGESLDFAVQCYGSNRADLGIGEDVSQWEFCGCLGADSARRNASFDASPPGPEVFRECQRPIDSG